MNLGIKAIESFIPEYKIDNIKKAESFNKNEKFLIDKIGAIKLPRMDETHDTSDLASLAIEKLLDNEKELHKEDIDAIVLITQNPDSEGLPHTSAIIQTKLSLRTNIAAFDVSLGCSGYIYGLYLLKGFLESSGLKNGVLVTCDPYSKIINQDDPNTSLLFGDAATATWIGSNPIWHLGPVAYDTFGSGSDFLKKEDGKLHMNGRQIFNFAARDAISQIEKLLDQENLKKENIDLFCLHQGSKAIVDYIIKTLSLNGNQYIFDIKETGNTVSSSIPIIFKKNFYDSKINKVVLCGFGVGLSSATAIIEKTK